MLSGLFIVTMSPSSLGVYNCLCRFISGSLCCLTTVRCLPKVYAKKGWFHDQNLVSLTLDRSDIFGSAVDNCYKVQIKSFDGYIQDAFKNKMPES